MDDLVDLHCHLLAGLDDGPRTWADALAMCRIACAEGVRHVAALAHQSDRWPVEPQTIRSAAAELERRLAEARVALCVYPTAEVTVVPELVEGWQAGRWLSLADRREYLLVELPHQLFLDLGPTVKRLARLGVRVVLAHPERHSELLHEPGTLEKWIGLGCLVQVSSASVTDPASKADARALRSWFRRGCVHFLGSDGHSPRKRRPLLAAAYQRVREWAGAAVAEQVGRRNGLAALRGESLRLALPRAERCWWPLRLW
jgi:protein-tyrosine phosphatase